MPKSSIHFIHQRSIIHENAKDYQKNEGRIHEAYDCLEIFLTKNKYVAGPEVRFYRAQMVQEYP